MRRGQIFILIVMSIIIILLFSSVAVLGISLVNSEISVSENELEIAAQSLFTPTNTPTPSATPTSTLSPTPTDTSIPTPTSTRVVNNTVTPTPSKTPTPAPATATPTNTPIPVQGGGGSGGSTQLNPTATPAPTSRYPFQIVDGPIEYETTNHFLVILAKVTANYGGFLPNYKLVGHHSPTGVNWESLPSCNHLCKASGPSEVYDGDGKLIMRFLAQEGNLFFEFPFYEEGVFTLMLVDPQGQQASEVFQLELSGDSEERKWFYMHFNR